MGCSMFSFFKDRNFSYPFVIWLIIVLWYSAVIYNFPDIVSIRHKINNFFVSQSFFVSRSLPKFSPIPEEAKNIVIVAFDEASRLHLNRIKWPWPRDKIAQLLKNVASFSPRVIGVDIVFSGRSEGNEDEALISVLSNHQNIVLAYKLSEGLKDLPLQDLIKTIDYGFVNRPVDESNILRDTRTFYTDREGTDYFSIDITILSKYLGLERNKVKISGKNSGVILGENLFIPSQGGITPLNYLLYPQEFVQIPAYLILEDKVDPEKIRDKIVLIGATDHLIHDEHFTPLGVFPGVAVIANSLVMMLSERYIHQFSRVEDFLLILLLGSLILLVNRKLSFAPALLYNLLILSTLFFLSLVLRVKDIQFDYLGVFFLGGAAYLTSNIYKHTYLTYMSRKLKSLAIIDPLTGFYSPRYFLLKIDGELKSRPRSLTFFALILSDYARLSLDSNFEEFKFLIKSLADYIESKMNKRFKNLFFSRIAQDIIGLALWGMDKDETKGFFKDFMEELKSVEFKAGDRLFKPFFKGALIYKPKAVEAKSEDLIDTMESVLKDFRKDSDKDFVVLEVKAKKRYGKEESLKDDILDFLTKDLEARNKDLENNLKALLLSRKEIGNAYFETMRAFVKALEEKDTYTQGHSERVAKYALVIAKESGEPQDSCDLIYKAALLHDIGKIGIPDYILHKKEKLSREEIELIRKHPLSSVEILKPIKAFHELLSIILHHHEWFNGTGYPYGLSGKMIPKGAQILSVADAFDAITCGRGYKEGKSVDEAVKELEKSAGTQLNSEYVQILKRAINSQDLSF